MLLILKLLSIACLVNLFIHSEPTNFLKTLIYTKIYKRYGGFDELWSWRLLSCALCLGFWIGLLFTFNILTACLISVLSELISKNLSGGL